jgi:hypothetical protein
MRFWQTVSKVMNSRYFKSGTPYTELVTLMELYDRPQCGPEVFYLGDSVVERVSRHDDDQRGLDEIVRESLLGQLKVASVSHTAYHLGVFYHLIRALEKMRQRPKIVILPINLRSFSPQWDLNPLWQFDQEVKALEQYLADSSYGSSTIKELVKSSEFFSQFDSTPISYPNTPFKYIGQFRAIINTRPETEELRKFRLEQIFTFHYMHQLTPDHPKLMCLDKITQLLLRMNISLVTYITPVNFQAGERYAGEAFSKTSKENAAIVSNIMQPYRQSSQINFLDFSHFLGSEYFFNKDDPTEHLNQEGRKKLANVINDAVLSLYAPAVIKACSYAQTV